MMLQPTEPPSQGYFKTFFNVNITQVVLVSHCGLAKDNDKTM